MLSDFIFCFWLMLKKWEYIESCSLNISKKFFAPFRFPSDFSDMFNGLETFRQISFEFK